MFLTIRGAVLSIAALAFATVVERGQQGPVKIGYVDPNPLMMAAPGRPAAESTFAKETAAYNVELKKLEDDINALLTEYSKGEPTFTAAQKATKQKAIDDKRLAAQTRQQELSQKLQARQDELMAPLREMITKALQDIRAEDGYSGILTSAGVLAA